MAPYWLCCVGLRRLRSFHTVTKPITYFYLSLFSHSCDHLPCLYIFSNFLSLFPVCGCLSWQAVLLGFFPLFPSFPYMFTCFFLSFWFWNDSDVVLFTVLVLLPSHEPNPHNGDCWTLLFLCDSCVWFPRSCLTVYDWLIVAAPGVPYKLNWVLLN